MAGAAKVHKQWIKLDNAAKLYAAIIRKNYSTFFRFEVHLDESVYAEALQEALGDTLRRYPLFQTRLRRGLFWYFLEEYHHEIRIDPIDNVEPCRYEGLKSTHNPLWRVFAGDARLALEVSHILTDGIGALEFFKTLLCRYYECAHEPLSDWETVRHFEGAAEEAEMEMSYKKHRRGRARNYVESAQSFRYPDKRGTDYVVTHMVMNAEHVKRAAKSMNTNVAGFLASVHLYAVQQLYGTRFMKRNGTVRDLLLVNLRPFFKSQTLRNFYLFVMVGIDFSFGHYDFDEIVNKVQAQMYNLVDPREIRRRFSYYVGMEENIFNRIVPWFVKTPVMRTMQFLSGETKMIGSISNIGKLDLPEAVSAKIKRVFFTPPPSRYMGRNISIIGHGNEITLTTGRYIQSNNVEREMAKILLSQNIDLLYLG